MSDLNQARLDVQPAAVVVDVGRGLGRRASTRESLPGLGLNSTVSDLGRGPFCCCLPTPLSFEVWGFRGLGV